MMTKKGRSSSLQAKFVMRTYRYIGRVGSGTI